MIFFITKSNKIPAVENKKAKAPSPPIKQDQYYLQLNDEKLSSDNVSLS